jgi:aerobic carbon-monoxide dehydrogenase large subunit
VIARSIPAAQIAADAIAISYEETNATPVHAQPLFASQYENSAIPAAQISQLESAQSVCFSNTQPRVSAFTMEPRACIAQWEADASKMTVWVGTQAVSRARDAIADALELPRESVRVIAPDVGGAFGAKASLYPEELLIALAARKLGAPLKWIATRSEEFLSATHGRGAALDAKLTFTYEGNMIALRANVNFPLGAWLAYSAAVPMRNATRILPGP